MSTPSQKERAMKINRPPIAKAKTLIRKPVAEVFEAFVNPAITSKVPDGVGKH